MSWGSLARLDEPGAETSPAPNYYRFMVRGIELMPFDVIEALGLNFNLGCVLKYIMRAGRKGPALDDLRKARNCLDREITRMEAKT
jgi:Protein of unknwon function (DUF3310)